MELKQLEIEPNEKAVQEQFNPSLAQIAPSSFPEYSVFPLATAVPMVEAATLDYPQIDWQQTTFTLSRFAYLHQLSGKMVLESPLSKFRITLLDSQASAIISLLSQPQTLTAVSVAFPHIEIEIIQEFIHLLLAAQFLSIEPEPLKLELWEFHNLLFHSRSRSGRHDYQTAAIEHWEQRELFPTVKSPMSEKIIPLFRPNLELLAQTDASLTQAIETRQSIREYDNYPITIEQLGELLYRCARVTEIYQIEEVGEVSRRPYPCGGARYELEIYPVVQQCEGLEAGLYHYDPLNHQLEQIADYNPEVAALIADARLSSGEQDTPQILLIITARFGRLFCKYKSLAYALVLKHVGVLYENLYLVATNMNLAPCALGAGNSDKFAQITGLDYYEESAVGEFMLGSMSRKVEAQGSKGAGEQENALTQNSLPNSKLKTYPVPSPQSPVPSPQSPIPNPTSFITPSAAPMNNADKLPGLYDLWAHTKGNPEITIVILDGNADLDRSCFQGADISKVFPYWHEPPEPIAPEYYEAFLEIEKSGEKGEAKAKKLQAAIPEPILNRLSGDFHATHIISTIIGQHGSPVPGIAPRCRAINIPLNTTGDTGEFISPINLTRAFELAMELGANIIHCAACCATQTGIAHDLLARAVKNCQDKNILIVAPTGNDKGECWCIPAILPGVLGVGMMKDNGKPANYSNWGGNYQYDGIVAPGENILGAQPTTEETKLNQGTSCSAPIVTGVSALLMSLQLQRGEKPNAEAVRQAILNSAIPCNPEEIEEPERCLRGQLNIPGAYQLLTGESLKAVVPAGLTTLPTSQNQIIPATTETFWSFQTPEFAEILSALDLSLLISVHEPYHLMGVNSAGDVIKTQFSGNGITFGLAGDRDKLAVSTGDRICLFHNSAKTVAAMGGNYDACYIPTTDYPTGDLDTHEMEWVGDELWFVNTKYSCLCTLDPTKGTVPQWFPPFISALAPEDRCHLNGMAIRDGIPRYVTAYSMTDTPEGWRDRANKEGILMDIQTNQVLLKGLSNPHSPRWHNNKLWVLESGTGSLLQVDPETGTSTKITRLPGFLRGLYFWENIAFVGVSSVRGELQQALPDSKAGIWAVNIITGDTVAFWQVKEENFYVYQVLGLPGVRSPKIMVSGEKLVHSADVLPNNLASTVTPANYDSSTPEPVVTAISDRASVGITPSAASKLVYALGTIGYDFGSEARRDTFKQLMPAVEIDGTMIPANPYDARQMVDYLSQNPSEAKALIWTLNQEQTPVYALEPRQGFSADVYEALIMMLAGQIEPENSNDFVERVSIPAKTADKTVQLFSGQEIPVITLINTRGMYAWKINNLVEAALQNVLPQAPQADEFAMRRSLTSFLNRVYFDFQNLGQISKDRALNFSVTNAFQAASSFAGAVSTGMQLDTIEVEKSPFCRINSDCWDVILKFFDPENGRRAKKVYRFTVDVSDRIPVTLGEVRSWSVPK